jgi:hypothetical protein
MAYQFHREDLHLGMILAFRRELAPDAVLEVKPRAISEGRTYTVEFIDTHDVQEMEGCELTRSIEFRLDDAPGSAIIIYSWQ